MKALAAVIAAMAAALPAPALAQGAKAALKKILPLESYEANTIGWTEDSDDVGFLDFKLSVKYPIVPERICSVDMLKDSRLYFAATTRFAQYLGTRESSPVVGKRFNPKLIWRQVTRWDEDRLPTEHSCARNDGKSVRNYVDFAFGHESNGQSVNSHELFLAEVRAQLARGGRPEFAKDYISRGWDYLEVAAEHSPRQLGEDKLTIHGSFRYFLEQGPLQGAAEEYNTWEDDPEGKPRRRVHGLALQAKYRIPNDYANWLGDIKLGASFETGYSRPFRHNTLRLEAGIRMWELPFMVFYQHGYGSDLALYYKRVESVGLAVEIASF